MVSGSKHHNFKIPLIASHRGYLLKKLVHHLLAFFSVSNTLASPASRAPMLSLPVELEREITIFQWSIRTSSDDVIAWRVCSCYHSREYCASYPRDVAQTLGLLHSRAPGFLTANVKTLCLAPACNGTEPRMPGTTEVCSLLAECCGVHNLACWKIINSSYDDHGMLDLIARLLLRTLSIKFQYFNTLREHHPHSPWLAHLTHLELIYWGDRWAPDGPQHPLPAGALSQLPSLAHIALSWGNDTIEESATRMLRADMADIVATASHLQMLIVIVGDIDKKHSLYSRRAIFSRHVEAQQDPRIVVIIAATRQIEASREATSDVSVGRDKENTSVSIQLEGVRTIRRANGRKRTEKGKSAKTNYKKQVG
ncbi:hypothetical protein B0H17DRAFT_1069414 [Mycena rosella]|uniref:Uncharacterized protein n=1 Tax=Mycena rosella TaxID=1033263 RepID=A0AAD7DC65_MYCRO|nr:hypothetical protein B0H17DRAFT_1069414 [Mycena rosella]